LLGYIYSLSIFVAVVTILWGIPAEILLTIMSDRIFATVGTLIFHSTSNLCQDQKIMFKFQSISWKTRAFMSQ